MNTILLMWTIWSILTIIGLSLFTLYETVPPCKVSGLMYIAGTILIFNSIFLSSIGFRLYPDNKNVKIAIASISVTLISFGLVLIFFFGRTCPFFKHFNSDYNACLDQCDNPAMTFNKTTKACDCIDPLKINKDNKCVCRGDLIQDASGNCTCPPDYHKTSDFRCLQFCTKKEDCDAGAECIGGKCCDLSKYTNCNNTCCTGTCINGKTCCPTGDVCMKDGKPVACCSAPMTCGPDGSCVYQCGSLSCKPDETCFEMSGGADALQKAASTTYAGRTTEIKDGVLHVCLPKPTDKLDPAGFWLPEPVNQFYPCMVVNNCTPKDPVDSAECSAIAGKDDCGKNAKCNWVGDSIMSTPYIRDKGAALEKMKQILNSNPNNGTHGMFCGADNVKSVRLLSQKCQGDNCNFTTCMTQGVYKNSIDTQWIEDQKVCNSLLDCSPLADNFKSYTLTDASGSTQSKDYTHSTNNNDTLKTMLSAAAAGTENDIADYTIPCPNKDDYPSIASMTGDKDAFPDNIRKCPIIGFPAPNVETDKQYTVCDFSNGSIKTMDYYGPCKDRLRTLHLSNR